MSWLLPSLSCTLTSLSRAFPEASGASVLSDLASSAALLEAEGLSLSDTYGRGELLQHFEEEIATSLGHEKALFVPSGVCGQMAALAVHARLPADRIRRELSPPLFITHPKSHIILREEDSYKMLLQTKVLLEGEADRPLSAKDVLPALQRLAAVGTRPACVICEVPQREVSTKCVIVHTLACASHLNMGRPRQLGCSALSWKELQALSDAARDFECPLHLDGARLLEVCPHYGKTPAEVAALFDTVCLSFCEWTWTHSYPYCRIFTVHVCGRQGFGRDGGCDARW